MTSSPSSLLKEIEKAKFAYGDGAADRKLELLRALGRRRMNRAKEVFRLHEALIFLRAFPDNREVFDAVERLLAGFASRGDLKTHRKELTDSGIAGTDTYYRFFWATALWLARRCPESLTIDWSEFKNKEKLAYILSLLVTFSETPALDDMGFSAREWINELKGPDETDAGFLIRRFAAIKVDSFTREWMFEDFDIPCRVRPGPKTPSRTCARFSAAPLVFQERPLDRSRPDLAKEILRPPLAIRHAPVSQAKELIDMTRSAMVSGNRDLDAFANADPNDVRLAECGGGLQFAFLGALPERRLMLETSYGFLTLKNGVPIGYGTASALFGSAEVAYNVFETFRGGESAIVFAKTLSVIRALLGSDAFMLDPYQLGYNNLEGLKSGAWWFYYKLGFRPVDPDVLKVLRAELKTMKAKPGYRSSLPTLNTLASENMYFYLKKPREDVMGRVSLGNIGMRTTRYLAERFGANREAGLRACAKDAARLLGVRSMRSFTPGESLAWQRWSPLVLAIPGVERWNAADKKALAKVMRAKGGKRESEFALLFNKHRRLWRALLKMAEED